MEVIVQNRQRAHRIGVSSLRAFLRDVSRHQPPAAGGAVTVRIVSDRAMREFNRTYRGRDETTDVLAFPADEEPDPDGERYLGDIVVSAQRAARQARDLGHGLARELKILVLHGYLHLLGYDHERDGGRMLRLQRKLLQRVLGAGGRRAVP
jgi:rRNA maturation RNase YbeY